MKSKKYRRCLSFICAAALVSALINSPAGRYITPYSAGVSVQAEGEVVPEGTKTQAMGILLTLLLGNGFRMVGSFADQSQALGEQFDQWVAETQATITAGAIVLGTRFQNGWMKLSSDVVNAYNSFSSWLYETLSVPTTGTVEVPLSGDINTAGTFVGGGLESYFKVCDYRNGSWQPASMSISADSDVFIRIYVSSEGAASYNLYACSYYAGKSFSLKTGANQIINTYSISSRAVDENQEYYYKSQITGFSAQGSVEWGDYDYIYYGLPANPPYSDMLDGAVPDDRILTGESLDLKDGINLDDDQALLLDMSALASYAGVLDQALTSAEDLIGALTNAIDRSKAEADEDEDAEVVPWDLVDTDTDSKVAPDDITETPPNETGMYKTLGLEKVFPFSIPFDIYYFIKMFNATAQAPEFDIPFVVTGVINERYHVDLSIFDPVAAIFRTMMLVGFIWFLITKTRDFLRS